MKNKKKRKKLRGFHPIVTFFILSLVTIVISSLLYVFNVGSTYDLFSLVSLDYSPITEYVIPLFNLSGLKYIFTNSVSNFANFTALINLIIILIGIGIMDKSGFLQTIVTLLTKKAKKFNVTFVITLICLIASVIGDLSYIIFLPLVSLFFYYGKRNPFIGLISAYGALAIGSGLSFVFTAIDSSLKDITVLNANVLMINYDFDINALFLINVIVILVLAFILSKITENYVAKKLPKYEFADSAIEEDIVTKKELKAMVLSLMAGAIYCIVILYNIIPGLPFSGNLLDNSQILYIDKLFSVDSFFSNGFVFIVTILFIIWGLVYGIVSKSIKNDKDAIDALGHSLDGIGKTLLMIFAASIFISIFSVSNIGNTITVYLANLIENVNFTGLPLVILLLIATMISTLVLPGSASKWTILSSSVVPAFMNTGLTPEFAQLVFRFGEAVTMGITPLLAYFVIYLAYMQKYNQSSKSIGITEVLKYQLPYALAAFCIVVIVLILFYITNVPLGIGGLVSL